MQSILCCDFGPVMHEAVLQLLILSMRYTFKDCEHAGRKQQRTESYCRDKSNMASWALP